MIPIMEKVGMAIGFLIWNSTNCLIGWVSSYFGLFGLTAKPASIPWMNFLGVGTVMLG